MSDLVLVASTEDFERLLETSASRRVLLLKHSLSCGISRSVLESFDAVRREYPDAAVYALLEIQNARSVSAEIAERIGVRHESPQAILLRDGKAAWSASHWDVGEKSLAKALAS